MVYEIKVSSYSVINYFRLRLINKSGASFPSTPPSFFNLNSQISNLKSKI